MYLPPAIWCWCIVTLGKTSSLVWVSGPVYWNWGLVVTQGWWRVPWENTNVLVWQRTYNIICYCLLVRDPEHYFHIAGNSAIWKNSNGNRCLRWACWETQNSLLHKTGTTKWTPDCVMTLDYLIKLVRKETQNSVLIYKNFGLRRISNKLLF